MRRVRAARARDARVNQRRSGSWRAEPGGAAVPRAISATDAGATATTGSVPVTASGMAGGRASGTGTAVAVEPGSLQQQLRTLRAAA